MSIITLSDVEEILDEDLQQNLIRRFHQSITGGHPGVTKTLKKLRMYYYWPKMEQQVKDLVLKCEKCQRCKHSPPNREPLCITSTAREAFERIQVDLVGKWNTTPEGYKYILTIQDDLSKFLILKPLRSKESREVAAALVQVILMFGLPVVIRVRNE